MKLLEGAHLDWDFSARGLRIAPSWKGKADDRGDQRSRMTGGRRPRSIQGRRGKKFVLVYEVKRGREGNCSPLGNGEEDGDFSDG